MVLVRVHPAIGHQAEQVAGAAAGAQRRGQPGQRRRTCDAAIGDRVPDAHQFLRDYAARAEVEVPDLRIAHLAARQADITAGGVQEGVRTGGPEPVEMGRAGLGDRVVRRLLSPAETVQDDEHDGARRHHGLRRQKVPI